MGTTITTYSAVVFGNEEGYDKNRAVITLVTDGQATALVRFRDAGVALQAPRARRETT